LEPIVAQQLEFSNGMKSIPNFIQICPAFLELNYADRQKNQHIRCSPLRLGREEYLIIDNNSFYELECELGLM
jgi:hypothetical protein